MYGVLVPSHDGRAGCAAITLDPAVYATPAAFPWPALLADMRKKLPKYAVPVFLRVQAEMKAMHNMKQNKTVLRAEGVELAKIRSGDAPGDVVLWCKGPAEKTYVVFGEGDELALKGGAVKL